MYLMFNFFYFNKRFEQRINDVNEKLKKLICEKFSKNHDNKILFD